MPSTRALAFALAPVLGFAEPALANGNADRGRDLYESRCFGCHSLDANRIGPQHRGVYGRKAGSAPGFTYSPALQNSAVVWNDETLMRWLSNPQELIPGQRMNFRVSLPQDRTDIIAYLRKESGR